MPKKSKVHFVGIGGAGMSALAQFHQMGGGQATGSDRLLDRGEIPELRALFEGLGVGLFAQDGSGIDEATEALVLTTAIEDDNPELARAGPFAAGPAFVSSYPHSPFVGPGPQGRGGGVVPPPVGFGLRQPRAHCPRGFWWVSWGCIR